MAVGIVGKVRDGSW